MFDLTIDYRHLHRMTDDTGMLQFSSGAVPDPASGYTLDDNARALLVAMGRGEAGYDLCRRYLRYLAACRQPDGSWSNLLKDGRYSNAFDSHDSCGRLILAFAGASRLPWPEPREQASALMALLRPRIAALEGLRSRAYALLGLAHGAPELLPSEERQRLLTHLAQTLLHSYWQCHTHGWYWFEDSLFYCNGILPQSLFAAYRVTGDPSCRRTAAEALDFLNDILFREGHLTIIGNQGWYPKGGQPALFDQQPVDAASICLANLEAWHVTGQYAYRELAQRAAAWFDGENTHRLSMIDPASGGCYDALTAGGVNLNQGAESLLSLLLTAQAMARLRSYEEHSWGTAAAETLGGVAT